MLCLGSQEQPLGLQAAAHKDSRNGFGCLPVPTHHRPVLPARGSFVVLVAPAAWGSGVPVSSQQGGRWAWSPKVWGPPGQLAGHVAGLLVPGTASANIHQGFSDCILKLGADMATCEEEDGIELQGLHGVCG